MVRVERGRVVGVIVGGLLAANCATSHGPGETPPAQLAARAAARPAPTMSGAEAPAPSPRIATSAGVEPSVPPSGDVELATDVATVDPHALALLQRRGFDLAQLTVGRSATTARELSELPVLADVFATARADVRRTARKHPLAKVTSIYGYRLFDERWLSSPNMSFPLVGVFNRLDRRAFHPGTCGEVRFVYRLAYDVEQGGGPMRGRLPMTVNVVFLLHDDDCSRHARAWQGAKGRTPVEAAEQLTQSGALSSELRRSWRLKSVETNLQTIRIQSSVHPTMGGHVDYAMRVFVPDASATHFVPAPMENMPDVPRLERDDALKEELRAYLTRPEVLADIDRGTLQLPARFLAKEATSVSPRGLSRLANRPFRQLFEPDDFAGLALEQTRTIRSPAALLRRLDEASCVGCHQSRAIAGFHHLGQEDDGRTFDSLYFGSSDHLRGDLLRRRQYVALLAEGAEPDEFRPMPERQGLADRHGSSCGLGDPGFADWTCGDGLVCQRLEDDAVGACLRPGALSSPCEWGRMLPNARPHKDYVTELSAHACAAEQVCDRNVQGFPLGFCAARCGVEAPGATCGEFLDVDGFQACLRAAKPEQECRQHYVFRTGLHACDDAHACRSDAVCMRTSRAGQGACVPPYFVFQLRLDGVPIE